MFRKSSKFSLSVSFLRKTCVASIMQRFLGPVSSVSATNAWHNDPPFVTLGVLPPRRHVVWRDSVGVRSSGSGLKSECADIFSSEPDLWLLRHTDEPQRGRNSCLWLQSRSVLSSFGVVLMSCRVNFHEVRSALQYSACRI